LILDGSGWCGGCCVKKRSFQKPGRKNTFGKSAEKLPNDREKGADSRQKQKFRNGKAEIELAEDSQLTQIEALAAKEHQEIAGLRLTDTEAGVMLSGVMARPLRIEYPAAAHHVMARGNLGRALFAADRDRRCRVETLGPTCGKTGWGVDAWVRTRNNHQLLLVETPEANLVARMKWLQGTRAQRQPKASKHATRPRAPISTSPVETGVFGQHREQNEMNGHQFPGIHSRMTRIGFCEGASAGGCSLSSSGTPLAKCHFSRTDPFTSSCFQQSEQAVITKSYECIEHIIQSIAYCNVSAGQSSMCSCAAYSFRFH
jgi:hypothetical protein